MIKRCTCPDGCRFSEYISTLKNVGCWFCGVKSEGIFGFATHIHFHQMNNHHKKECSRRSSFDYPILGNCTCGLEHFDQRNALV